jgi:hypothetical protein
MTVRNLRLGIVLAGCTLAATTVFAQSPKEGGSGGGGGASSERSTGGGGPANSGGGGGSAGGGGGIATGGGSSSSSSGGGVSFSSPSGAGAAASDLSFGSRGFRESAPQHRAGFAASRTAAYSDDGQKATPRTASGSSNSGGSGGAERAVPRGTAAGSSGSGNGSGSGARTRTPPNENNAAGTREVPNWSRPRGDRPTTGVAVERVGPPPDRNGYRGRYYDPYYYGYGGGYYDPFGYSYYGYYPYMFGMGYGLYSGLGWNPYFGDPYDPYYSGSGGYSSGIYNTHDQGNLKLKVKPRSAKVYVDGYFVGMVDQFDGAFQKLPLNGGRHKVEIRAEGFETAEFDVLITPDQTVTFQGELKRFQ